MNLKNKIEEDLKKAVLAKEKFTSLILRMLLAALKNAEIEKGKDKPFSNSEIIAVLSSEAKKRKEAILEYKKAQREDLAKKEEKEINLILKYLPKQLEEEEIRELALKIIEKVGAKDLSDLGKAMGEIMPQIKGRAEGKVVNRIVRQELEKRE